MLSHRNQKYFTRLKKIIQHSALLIIFLLGCWELLNCPLQAQSQKDYIYLDGKAIAVDSRPSSLQPTCLSFVETIGFAGLSPGDIDICNGANMKVWVRYDFTPWQGGETVRGIENLAGTANASGRIVRNPLPQNTTPGTSVVTAIRNDLILDWHQLSPPYPQFTMRPAKPISFTINGGTSYTVTLPGQSTESAGNSQNQTVYSQYHMTLPSISTDMYFPFPLDSNAQQVNTHPCIVGNTSYLFNRVRNQLDTMDDGAWNNVSTGITYTRGSTCSDFTVSSSPSTQTISQPQATVSFAVTASPINGFNVPVTLSVTGLPAGATGSFSLNPVNPNQTSTLTITTPSNLSVGTYSFTIQASIQGGNGYLTRNTSASIYYNPSQPGCFAFGTSEGFAGISPSDVSLCSPNMTIEVQYTYVAWTGGSYQGQGILGTTDATGWVRRSLPQNTAPGTSYVTAYRNVLRSDWVTASNSPHFTVRPPKPTGMGIQPSILHLPGYQVVYVGNEQNQGIGEVVLNPDGTTYEYGLAMDGNGMWQSGLLPCWVMPGEYDFLAVHNGLDPAPDAYLTLSGVGQIIYACGQ